MIKNNQKWPKMSLLGPKWSKYCFSGQKMPFFLLLIHPCSNNCRVISYFLPIFISYEPFWAYWNKTRRVGHEKKGVSKKILFIFLTPDVHSLAKKNARSCSLFFYPPLNPTSEGGGLPKPPPSVNGDCS